MPLGYVYALHDFNAENEDEIPFRAGERIEVVEKDDEFGDGWWHGRNLAGKLGLFPQNYTTPDPPHPSSTLPPITLTHAPDTNENGSAQMAATLTDVQAAIEQLGIGKSSRARDPDGRSLSFMSGTETDHEESEAEGDETRNSNKTPWGVGSRQLLADKARRELEDRQRREMVAAAAPPIEVDMSEESESEPEQEEDSRFKSVLASVQPTPVPQQYPTPTAATFSSAGQQTLGEPKRSPSAASSKTSLLIQQAAKTQAALLTVTNPDAPSPSEGEHSPIAPALFGTTLAKPGKEEPPKTEREIVSPAPRKIENFADTQSLAMATPLPRSPSPVDKPMRSFAPTPPAPAVVTPSPPPAPRSVLAPTPPPPPTLAPAAVLEAAPAPAAVPASVSTPTSPASNRPADPNIWSTEDVLYWLESKKFDSTVIDKFAEQDITGDVLLQLDLALLKDELGITAFGKRVRLNNAIIDLKKSIEALGNLPVGSPGQGQDVPLSSQSMPAGLLYSPESAPRTGEMSSSDWGAKRDSDGGMKSDEILGLGFAGVGMKGHRPSQLSVSSSDGALSARGKRSTVGSGDVNFIAEEDESGQGSTPTDADSATVGSKGRAPRSNGSHSSHGPDTAQTTELASGSTSVKHPGDTPSSSIPPSPGSPAAKRGSVDNASAKRPGSSSGSKSAKRTSDGPKDSRLSFFGGTIGKGRKPAPRYSSETGSAETSPTFPPNPEKRSLSRLYLGGSSHKKAGSGGSSVRLSSGAAAITASPVSIPTTSPNTPGEPGAPPNVLRKRLSSANSNEGLNRSSITAEKDNALAETPENANALEQIGEPDHEGWMRKKGERYGSWKARYFVLKGRHLYYMRSKTETKIKGYINVTGYKVVADENANVGKYGFRIVHDTEKPHYFSSEEQMVIREWMKAIMKATIGRDYSRPVISSCNIPTIPLNVAQAMSPAPRPPSPSAREATQRALRPANPDKLSDRDAAILMLGVKGQERPGDDKMRQRVESVFTYTSADSNDYREAKVAEPTSPLPPRPSRDVRQPGKAPRDNMASRDRALLDWVNDRLPNSASRATDLSQSMASGLVLFRLIERLSGKLTGVPDSVFLTPPDQEESFEGLFRLFDVMVENGISTADVSMSDMHVGNKQSVTQLIEAIKEWDARRS